MAIGVNLPDIPPLNLQQVNTGLQPDDGLGDTWFVAFGKHNANMEKLGLFANQVIAQINSINDNIAVLVNDLNALENRVDALEAYLAGLQNSLPTDLSDILARLAALEARVGYIPIQAYSEKPVSVFGFGRPQLTGFSQVKALGFGNPAVLPSIRVTGVFTGTTPIRVMLVNDEWLVTGQDERVNTATNATWHIFFSLPVKVEDVRDITFTNQYTGSGNPATVSSTQTITAVDRTGTDVSHYSSTTTYELDRLVADNASVYAAGTKWYRSKANGNVGNALTSTTHWEEVPKRVAHFKVVAEVTSAGGERFLKLGFPATAVVRENADGTGRQALMPCLDRGLLTVVAA